MVLWLMAFLIIGPPIGAMVWRMYERSQGRPDVIVPEWDQPSGRIHLLDGDRYFDSSPTNPYEHSALDWSSGRFGCVNARDLVANPLDQQALVGTVKILKPANEKGMVIAILDNNILAALGRPKAELSSGAKLLLSVPTSPMSLHANY